MASANHNFAIPEGYFVTREGVVYSTKNGRVRALKPRINGSGYGYPSVRLQRNGKQWHVAIYRLVAATYLQPRPSTRHHILHIDADRMNSHADNLKWGTASENQYQAWQDRRKREMHARSNAHEPLPF